MILFGRDVIGGWGRLHSSAGIAALFVFSGVFGMVVLVRSSWVNDTFTFGWAGGAYDGKYRMPFSSKSRFVSPERP